jgi:hypothetical protein
MIKVLNNMWSLVKMSVVLLIMVITMKYVGTEQLLKAAGILLGFYTSFRLVDLLFMYLKSKIKGLEVDNETKPNKPEEDKVNPEILYVEGLINEIKKKAKKSVKDKNTLDLLGIKLKQLKNI